MGVEGDGELRVGGVEGPGGGAEEIVVDFRLVTWVSKCSSERECKVRSRIAERGCRSLEAGRAAVKACLSSFAANIAISPLEAPLLAHTMTSMARILSVPGVVAFEGDSVAAKLCKRFWGKPTEPITQIVPFKCNADLDGTQTKEDADLDGPEPFEVMLPDHFYPTRVDSIMVRRRLDHPRL